MTFSENIGVKIDTEVKNFLLRGVQREGLKSKFARAIGVTAMNLSRWLGETKRNVDYITWDQWDKVRDYLIKNREIDPTDTRWMPPSALRDALASSAASVSGTGNIVAGRDAHATPLCAEEIESFRSALIMELIELDIEITAKDQVLRLVRNFRRRQD